jgi:hypothetical protein
VLEYKFEVITQVLRILPLLSTLFPRSIVPVCLLETGERPITQTEMAVIVGHLAHDAISSKTASLARFDEYATQFQLASSGTLTRDVVQNPWTVPNRVGEGRQRR